MSAKTPTKTLQTPRNSGSATYAETVNLSSTDYDPSAGPTSLTSTRGVYVGVPGDLKADLVEGGTVTFTALAGGVVHPLAVSKIYRTGTTATNIVALF